MGLKLGFEADRSLCMMSLPLTLSVSKTIDVQCTACVEYERGMVSIPTGQLELERNGTNSHGYS